jgi:hypothetical protein
MNDASEQSDRGPTVSWQALRDMYDEIDTPLTLVRFANDVVNEIIADAPISPDAKADLQNEVRDALDRRIRGYDYVLANYLITLMTKLPAADPYQHVGEEEQ